MPPRKGKAKEEQPVVSLAPPIAEGENRFGVAHIFASFNDTFVHVTDLSGKIRDDLLGKSGLGYENIFHAVMNQGLYFTFDGQRATCLSCWLLPRRSM